jgi:hypothetical protein
MSLRFAQFTCAVGASLFATSALSAAVLDNFESYPVGNLPSPPYNASGNLSRSFVGDAGALGAALILEGSQSLYHYGPVEQGYFAARGFGAAASEVANGSIISSLYREEVDGTAGQGAFYLSDNAGIGGGGTVGGVLFDQASNTVQLSNGGTATPTTYAYIFNNVYKVEMELNFTTDTFDAYITNTTTGGPRTFLGTQAFGAALDAATFASDGGILLTKQNASAANVVFDDITVTAVPEPAAIGLLGIGAMGLMRRRR